MSSESALHKSPRKALTPRTDITQQISELAARKEVAQMHPGQKETLVPAAKLAKNKRLPATMITPGGHIEQSKKNKKGRAESSKKKKRSEIGKEKALERLERLQTKVGKDEERKVGVWGGVGPGGVKGVCGVGLTVLRRSVTVPRRLGSRLSLQVSSFRPTVTSIGIDIHCMYTTNPLDKRRGTLQEDCGVRTHWQQPFGSSTVAYHNATRLTRPLLTATGLTA